MHAPCYFGENFWEIVAQTTQATTLCNTQGKICPSFFIAIFFLCQKITTFALCENYLLEYDIPLTLGTYL